MLTASGLGVIVKHFQTLSKPLSNHAQTSNGVLELAMSNLDRFLLGMNVDISESLYRIQSLDISKRVSRKGSLKFLSAYKDICFAVTDPENQVCIVSYSLKKALSKDHYKKWKLCWRFMSKYNQLYQKK
jgi:hypothetical protein